MNKELIQERIKLLEQEREQARNTLIAYEGAIQDCKYWLEQVESKSIEKDDK